MRKLKCDKKKLKSERFNSQIKKTATEMKLCNPFCSQQKFDVQSMVHKRKSLRCGYLGRHFEVNRYDCLPASTGWFLRLIHDQLGTFFESGKKDKTINRESWKKRNFFQKIQFSPPAKSRYRTYRRSDSNYEVFR